MDFIKNLIRQHKWLVWPVLIFDVVIIFLPQWLDSVWDLAEKFKGRQIAMPHPDIIWVYWITIPLSLAMLGFTIWAIKTAKSSTITETKSVSLKISYRDQKWGYNAAVANTNRMVIIGIDYNPMGLMQVAKAYLAISNSPPIESWGGFTVLHISMPEYHTAYFYLPNEPEGVKKATLSVLANNELWRSEEFDLNVPPKTSCTPNIIGDR